MKLLVFTDLHGDLKYLEKLLQKAKKEKPAALVCAGDLTNFGYGLRTLLQRFAILKIPLFIIPGNHETEDEIKVYSKGLPFVHNIHLRSEVFHSVCILGCGGGGFTAQHAEFELSERKFAASIKKLKIKDHRYKVILVTHQPPYKTKLDYICGEYVGSTSIRKFIEKHQPDVCITGHIHPAEGLEDKIGHTRVINPGPTGKIIEI